MHTAIRVAVMRFSKKLKHNFIFVVVVVTRPISRDGGMAEDLRSPEAGQLPRPWIRGRRETGSHQKASGRNESVAGQCRM